MEGGGIKGLATDGVGAARSGGLASRCRSGGSDAGWGFSAAIDAGIEGFAVGHLDGVDEGLGGDTVFLAIAHPWGVGEGGSVFPQSQRQMALHALRVPYTPQISRSQIGITGALNSRLIIGSAGHGLGVRPALAEDGDKLEAVSSDDVEDVIIFRCPFFGG